MVSCILEIDCLDLLFELFKKTFVIGRKLDPKTEQLNTKVKTSPGVSFSSLSNFDVKPFQLGVLIVFQSVSF